jgi:hypothetical protein
LGPETWREEEEEEEEEEGRGFLYSSLRLENQGYI